MSKEIIAFNDKKETFEINENKILRGSGESNLEKQIKKNNLTNYYHNPFDKLISVNKKNNTLIDSIDIHPNDFYPLLPLDYIYSLKKISKGELVFPVYLFFNPSNACNYNCNVCFSHEQRTKNKVDINAYKDVINIMAENNNVIGQSISGGGEPLTHPDLKEMLTLSGELDVKTFLTTNASIKKKDLLDSIVKNTSVLCISAQGTGEESYRINTGSDFEFMDLKKNISDISRLREQNSSDLLLGVNALIYPNNTGQNHDFVSFLVDNGFDYIHFNPILPSLQAHNLKYNDSIMKHSQEEFNKIKDDFSNDIYVRFPQMDNKTNEKVHYTSPKQRVNQDVCLVSRLMPALIPSSDYQNNNYAKFVACRFQPNITENPNFYYSDKLSEEKITDIWTLKNQEIISNYAKDCDVCCTEKQLLTLDWCYSQILKNPDVEFMLGYTRFKNE